MYSLSLLPVLGLLAVTFAREAPESNDSHKNATYAATFDDKAVGGVLFYSNDGYVSVGVALDLPKEGGPFSYRIHEKPVPSSGDCSAASGDFNPYNGRKQAKFPAEMEVGDLSGKHGLLFGNTTFQVYEDRYLSLNSKNEANVAGLSVVVENADGEVVGCSNIEALIEPPRGPAKKLADKLKGPKFANYVT